MIALPAQYGITSGFLAALCGFLLITATVVFVAVPGPDTLRTLLYTVPLAGAVLVVAVLLLLSTSADLRWLWALIAVAAGAWTATAVWRPADPATDRRDRLQGIELPAALYEPTDDGYVATALTIGPWDPGLQHAGPPAALLLREAERASGIADGQTVRMAYDIFAPVPVGPVHVQTSVVRPGRRMRAGREAVLTGIEDRPLMRLSAWRMRTAGRTGPRSARGPAAPGRRRRRAESLQEGDAGFFTEDVAYHRALEVAVRLRQLQLLRASVGVDRPRCELVAGEPMTPLQHLVHDRRGQRDLRRAD